MENNVTDALQELDRLYEEHQEITMLQTRPMIIKFTEVTIQKLCHGLGHDWFRFALHLGFSQSQLEDLTACFVLEARCQEVSRMICQWCRLVSARYGHSQTITLLMSLLSEIDRNDLVEQFGIGVSSVSRVPVHLDEDLLNSIQKVCLCPGAVTNGKAQLQSRIEKWMRDSAIFYETRAYKHIKQQLEKFGVVTIIGKQGDGKTAIAEQLVLVYLSQDYKVVVVNSPEEWKEKWNPQVKQVIFLDDVFGRTQVFSDVTLEQWTLKGEEMRECNERGLTKVVSTVRDYIFKDCKHVQNVELFKNVVNVSSDTWKLENDEKYEILKCHLQNNQIHQMDERSMREIAQRDCIQGFPLRCRLFVSDRRLQEHGFTFFSRHLSDILTDELRYMKRHDRLKHAALVLLMLCDGTISENQFEIVNKTWIFGLIQNIARSVGIKQSKGSENLFASLKSELNLSSDITFEKLKESLLTMTGSYVTYFDRQYKFVHDCVAEAVASLFGNSKRHQIFFVKHCSTIALQQYVRLDHEVNEHMLPVSLDPGSYLALAQRLTGEIASGNAAYLLQTDRFTAKQFTDVWMSLLSKKQCREVKSLFFQKDKYNKTLLQWATKHGNINLLRFSLAYDVCPSQLMLDAACMDQTASVKFLLAKGADVNACNGSGQPALLVAATHGNIALTEILLDKGANVNTTDEKGCSALHSACVQGNGRIAELLIHHKVSVNCTDKNGCTALFHASCQGHLQIVQLLLDNGADPSVKNNYDGTPFFASCVNGHWDITKLLLRQRPDLSLRDYIGRSVLHWVCLRGFSNIARLIVENGADISMMDHYGRTPMHYAAKGGDRYIWHLLMDAGASLFVTDNDGQTPVSLANKESKIPVLF